MKKRFLDNDYSKLRKTPRYTDVHVTFLERPLVAPDAASLLFLNKELFDLEIYKFKSTSTRPYIIDCGANIGLSIIYFKELFPHAEILAFEPDLHIFNYLSDNINTFEYQNVTLVNKGLWKEKTTLFFTQEGSDAGKIEPQDNAKKQVSIPTTTLSNYLNRPVDFLKIDIEGAEFEVLEECKQSLTNVKNLFIEYHSCVDKPQQLSSILAILEQSGFRYYVDHIGVQSPHPFININTAYDFDNQLNIFAYRVNDDVQ